MLTLLTSLQIVGLDYGYFRYESQVIDEVKTLL